MNTWEPTAIELLSGYKLTVGELGDALETTGYTVDVLTLSRWLKHETEIGELIRTGDHPPRFYKINTPEAA